MTVQDEIEQILDQSLTLAHLEVVNESGNHNVPAGSESHFKAVMVAAEFEGLPLIKRHRLVNGALADIIANKIHALALHTFTESEWVARHGAAPMSPPCLGGSAAQRSPTSPADEAAVAKQAGADQA